MEIKQLYVLCAICLLTLSVQAQSDTIPKKNKEAKTHFGAYYSIGLSSFSVKSSQTTESFLGQYQNFGFMVETKLYKKLWLELNLNKSLNRDGKINFKQDTFNADIFIKRSGESTAILYIKYQIITKSKWSMMAKLGLGFGTFNTEVYNKDISSKQTEYFYFYTHIGNQNYYTFSAGFDINYKIKKHLMLFSQVLFNTGMNILIKPEYIHTGNLSRYIHMESLIPHTLIYSLGIKF